MRAGHCPWPVGRGRSLAAGHVVAVVLLHVVAERQPVSSGLPCPVPSFLWCSGAGAEDESLEGTLSEGGSEASGTASLQGTQSQTHVDPLGAVPVRKPAAVPVWLEEATHNEFVVSPHTHKFPLPFQACANAVLSHTPVLAVFGLTSAPLFACGLRKPRALHLLYGPLPLQSLCQYSTLQCLQSCVLTRVQSANSTIRAMHCIPPAVPTCPCCLVYPGPTVQVPCPSAREVPAHHGGVLGAAGQDCPRGNHHQVLTHAPRVHVRPFLLVAHPSVPLRCWARLRKGGPSSGAHPRPLRTYTMLSCPYCP